MLSKSSITFPINNMSSTYNMRNATELPLTFLVNAGFSISLHKPKRFDHIIKVNVPTPRCLHQPIDGALELAYLVTQARTPSWIDPYWPSSISYQGMCFVKDLWGVLIHLFSMARRSTGKSVKVHTSFSYMDPISDFMASSHLSESGPAIASS